MLLRCVCSARITLATSLGNNLIGTGGAGIPFTDGVNGDQVGTTYFAIDPMLGPLADNGGPTQTHVPLAGSPLIDAGDNASAPATDQRGDTRILDGNGEQSATFTVPPGQDPDLDGAILQHAYMLLDPTTLLPTFVSNVVTTTFVP